MQEVISGPGCIQDLLPLLSRSGAKQRILLLTYKGAFSSAPIQTLISELNRRHELRHLPFSTKLLTTQDLAQAVQWLGSWRPEVLVAIGGGSVQDLAKCLKALICTDSNPAEILQATSRGWIRELLQISIPTTAGTGSEATPFAAIYENGVKQSVEDHRLIPDAALLDPLLLSDVPRATRIHSGLDALSQSLESVWSIHATEASLRDSLEAVKLLWQALPKNHPEQMQKGAYLSGKAIAVSRTTLAHALSYPLTSSYGVPHGLAVFLILPSVVRFNSDMRSDDCVDPQGMGHYRLKMRKLFEAIGVRDHEELAQALEKLLDNFGIALRLPEYGVADSEALQKIIRSALSSSRSGNNPRRASLQSLARYFKI